MLLATIACGLLAGAAGVYAWGYDYDEVLRAHSIWLASQGLRPYNDFFEVHPPYFILLTPLIRGQPDPLSILRIFASAGNLLFLAGLGVLGGSLVGVGARRWAWLGVAVVAMHPDILAFLVEFRIDGWGYALAAWSFVRHRRPGSGLGRQFELGVCTGIATLWFCPKLTILPALVVGFGESRDGLSLRRLVQSGGAYAAGVAVAVALFLAFLTWQGIEWGRMVQLLIRYHMVSGANAGFHLGLLGAVLGNRLLLGLILGGIAAWGLSCCRRRAWPGAYELGLLVWLIAQAGLVAYPYKQYFAPWFLFASGYLGFIGQGSATWLRRARAVPFLVAALAASLGAIQAAWGWVELGEARDQKKVIQWMERVTTGDDRVVASPPVHPIDRFDSFWVWFSTADPAGFDTERILARLPTYREMVSRTQFDAELERHPPALVLLSGSWRMVGYPEGQQRALEQFLPRRGYQVVTIGPLRFAVRPDRLDRANQAR